MKRPNLICWMSSLSRADKSNSQFNFCTHNLACTGHEQSWRVIVILAAHCYWCQCIYRQHTGCAWLHANCGDSNRCWSQCEDCQCEVRWLPVSYTHGATDKHTYQCKIANARDSVKQYESVAYTIWIWREASVLLPLKFKICTVVKLIGLVQFFLLLNSDWNLPICHS